MNDQMLTGMREALELLQRGGPLAATGKIQETLLGLLPSSLWPGATPAAPPTPDPAADPAPNSAPEAPPAAAKAVPDLTGLVPDLVGQLTAGVPGLGRPFAAPGATTPAAAADRSEGQAPGPFLSGSYGNRAGTRSYKLYVPSAWQGQPLPLVVVLHGGQQTPDDCADGTGFNALAEDWPALVLYPAQSQSANATLCWNWFNVQDQQPDTGEPSIIAGMTREVMATYGVDPQRVYCAGISAGAAMAVILGVTHRDLYAAVGTHSGMPYASASDFSSAFSAMNGHAAATPGDSLRGVPVIAFHGDRDATVHPRNSDRILAQTLPPEALVETEYGRAGTGHAYTRRVHTTPDGRVLAEQWLVHGAGHAWSGGRRHGSFTDTRGPDASREMMRFFAAQGGAGR